MTLSATEGGRRNTAVRGKPPTEDVDSLRRVADLEGDGGGRAGEVDMLDTLRGGVLALVSDARGRDALTGEVVRVVDTEAILDPDGVAGGRVDEGRD